MRELASLLFMTRLLSQNEPVVSEKITFLNVSNHSNSIHTKLSHKIVAFKNLKAFE
jgi:hypothetical protein